MMWLWALVLGLAAANLMLMTRLVSIHRRVQTLYQTLFGLCLFAYLNRARPAMLAHGLGVDVRMCWISQEEFAAAHEAEANRPL